MKKIFAVLAFLMLLLGVAGAQSVIGNLPDSGPALPATCSAPQLYFVTTPGSQGLYSCVNNAWVSGGNSVLINAAKDCSVPTDGSTDAYPALQACVNAHPSAYIVLPKVQPYGSCDYMISQTVFLLGAGQWIAGGAGSPSTNENGATKICTSQVGVTAFWGNNQYAPSFHLSDLSLNGSEPFSRTVLADFVLPFGWSYPSVAWVTGSTSSSTTLTTTAASEIFLAQNVGQTVQVVAGDTAISTTPCTTTANNASITCTGGSQSHVGQSIYIPGAGTAGAGFSAHILGYCNSCAGLTNGTYQLDVVTPTAVSGVTSTYAYDTYATINSLTDSHDVVISKAGGNNFTGLTVYVGSRADGVRGNSVKTVIERVTAQNFGRDGFHAVSGGNVGDMPYVGVAGHASDLADEMHFTDITATANRGQGYYIAGGDVNVSLTSASHFSNNQLWGYFDNSFLGSKGDTINAATNHQDCTQLPCGPTGGGTNFTTSTATLKNVATAPPAAGTDWVCNSNTSVTTGGSTPFSSGQVGMVITLPGCGTAGATLVTTVATFVTSSSITITDPAASTNTVTATARIWPTVTKTSGTAFSAGMVGKDISILYAGANGQALYTTIAQFYNANTVAINAAPVTAVATNGTIYYGTNNYPGRDIWTSAWKFTTGAITSGLKVLTLTAANELFVSQMCSGATNGTTSPQIIVTGAGLGGTDLNTTCATFTNSQSLTLNTAAGTTVSGATVYVQAFGGSYLLPNVTGPEICVNCYGETDQQDSPRMAAPPSTFTGGLVGDGTGTSSGIQNLVYTSSSGKDSSATVALQAGNTLEEQLDLFFEGVGKTVYWDFQKTPANDFRIYNSSNSTKQRMAFLQGSFSEFDTDQTISSTTTETFRFKCGTGTTLATCLKFDNSGDIYFHTNSGITTYFKLTGTPTGARILTFPDASIQVAGVGNMSMSPTAPTISSGFGTTPSIVQSNGTAAFTINVGTGGTATSGVIGLPTATHGWAVNCTDITTTSATVFMTKQTATTTTSATVGNFNTSAAAAAWVASDVLSCTAMAY